MGVTGKRHFGASGTVLPRAAWERHLKCENEGCQYAAVEGQEQRCVCREVQQELQRAIAEMTS